MRETFYTFFLSDPTLKSNWAVNFADPAVLDPDTGLDFPVRQLREAPVHEPQVRPSTKMSPRLRSRVITANQISEHRSKSAFLPTLDADHKENRNQLPRKNLKSATASTQTTPLRVIFTMKKLSMSSELLYTCRFLKLQVCTLKQFVFFCSF